MPTTALLVIDIQRGAFDGVRCPRIDRSGELVSTASALIHAARQSSAPVLFIQHCDEPGQAFEEATPHFEFHEELGPLPNEIVVRKRESSAFEGIDLQAILESLNIRSLIVCGLQSEFCVCNTSRAALGLGYKVFVAHDGHSTWPSGGKSSQAIADDVNDRLAELGALLEPASSLEHALRARA